MRTPAPVRDNLFGTVYSLIASKTWRNWFSELDNQYEQVERWTDPTHTLFGKVEPPLNVRRTGLQAYANGTDWNPGSGAGYYYFNGATWTFIA